MSMSWMLISLWDAYLKGSLIVTASGQKAIKAIFTIFSSEFKTSDVLNTWLPKKWRAQTWLCVWPRSIYQYSEMAPRLSSQKWFFLSFFCLSIPKRCKENNPKFGSFSWKPRTEPCQNSDISNELKFIYSTEKLATDKNLYRKRWPPIYWDF